MGRVLIDNPKQDKHGNTQLIARVDGPTRSALVAIAKRRGEQMNVTVNKALTQYIAADQRRGPRGYLGEPVG